MSFLSQLIQCGCSRKDYIILHLYPIPGIVLKRGEEVVRWEEEKLSINSREPLTLRAAQMQSTMP